MSATLRLPELQIEIMFGIFGAIKVQSTGKIDRRGQQFFLRIVKVADFDHRRWWWWSHSFAEPFLPISFLAHAHFIFELFKLPHHCLLILLIVLALGQVACSGSWTHSGSAASKHRTRGRVLARVLRGGEAQDSHRVFLIKLAILKKIITVFVGIIRV